MLRDVIWLTAVLYIKDSGEFSTIAKYAGECEAKLENIIDVVSGAHMELYVV